MARMYFDMNGWITDPVLVEHFISRIDTIEMMIEASPGINLSNVSGVNSLEGLRETAREKKMYHTNSLNLIEGIEVALSAKETLEDVFDEYIEDQINDITATCN